MQTSFHGIPNNLDGRIGKEKIGRRQTDKQGTNREGEKDKQGTNREGDTDKQGTNTEEDTDKQGTKKK